MRSNSLKMTSKEEVLRSRIVQFYEKNHSFGKSYCVKHFVAEGVSKRTIYAILKSGRIDRKSGSGRKAAIMTNKNKRKLKKLFENKDDISQNDAAKKFNCSQQYISKTLKSIGLKARKKEKAPSYTESQIKAVKSNCRWMVRNFKGKSFVSQNIPFVPKNKNPTNLPQCRPIEDFFGQLSEKVYKNNWKAKNIQQLQRRIRKCLKEIDTSGVQKACSSISTKLRTVADKGPFAICH